MLRMKLHSKKKLKDVLIYINRVNSFLCAKDAACQIHVIRLLPIEHLCSYNGLNALLFFKKKMSGQIILQKQVGDPRCNV